MELLIGLTVPMAGTALGAALVFLIRDRISQITNNAMLGFASGIMVAASFWSLLQPALEQTGDGLANNWPVIVGFIAGMGFLLLLDTIIELLEGRSKVARHVHINYGALLEEEIRRLSEVIRTSEQAPRQFPIRYWAAKLIEGDPLVVDALSLSQNEQETVEHILQQMEEERGLDRQAAIATMRFDYINSICQRTVIRPADTKEYLRSQIIDKVLTGKWTALPSFIAIMAVVFWLTFDGIGGWLQEQVEMGVEWFTSLTDTFLSSINIAPAIQSLVIDGIYSGVGTVIVFLPLILMLFFFLSMMEDSGYMARIAFVMDRPLRKLGLSGRSIVPLLLGFGCSVPSVMSSRTLPSVRDRRLTIMLTPFMSCTAKIPIYAFFAAAFFPDNAALVMFSLYVLGILVSILVAVLMKHTWFRGEAVPFVMELPNYRLPVPSNVLRLLWDKASDFLRRAFTVIFLASMVIWFLQTFTFHLKMVAPGMEHESMLAQMAGLLQPIFQPLGLGDWRIVTSLISGLLAKEVVVSTLSTLFADVPLTEIFTTATAYAMMVFCLLYTPCIAAMATIRRELGNTWAMIILVFQCVIAWLAAFAITLIL